MKCSNVVFFSLIKQAQILIIKYIFIHVLMCLIKFYEVINYAFSLAKVATKEKST